MKKYFIFLFFLQSCVMFAGERTTVTHIDSNPQGSNVYVLHTEGIHNSIYKNLSKARAKDGTLMSFYGVTPIKVTVPRGKNTRILLEKNGYEKTEFTVNANRETVYYEGKNTACFGDKYYAWAFGGVWDEVVNQTVFKKSKSDYCKDIRHWFFIHLKPIGYDEKK